MIIYWVSRHELSPAQKRAIRDLHGEDAEVMRDPVVFSNTDGLAEYIRSKPDGFVYAVAGAIHYIAAALAGLRFGVFENHPQKRQDGSFGLAAVYHVDGPLKKVWVNPDPESDKGEALVPVGAGQRREKFNFPCCEEQDDISQVPTVRTCANCFTDWSIK